MPRPTVTFRCQAGNARSGNQRQPFPKRRDRDPFGETKRSGIGREPRRSGMDQFDDIKSDGIL
jgi:hypothetical protein